MATYTPVSYWLSLPILELSSWIDTVKNINTNKVWSNTYAPINIKPDRYEVVFASDKIKYLRKDGLITTKTEVIVTRDHHAEIRKIFKFSKSVRKSL